MRITAAAAALLLAAAAPGAAQDAGPASSGRPELLLEADAVSRNIWRGQDLGAVSLQPTVGIAWKGLSLTAWGSIGLSQPDDDEEIDITLAYGRGRWHAAVTDYWFAYSRRSILDGLAADPSNRYFSYGAHDTNHVFEANVGYDFGPVALDWFTNFAGCDGTGPGGSRAYSSYVQAQVPFTLAACQWTATVGAVAWATDFYDRARGFAVTDVSLRADKELRVTGTFSLPLFAGVTANPSTQKAWIFFGLTIRP